MRASRPVSDEASPPTLGKSLLFSALILGVFAILVEGLLAALGVEPVPHRDDPYVGFASRVPLFVADVDAAGGAIYRTAENKLSLFNDQRFAAEKPEGIRRAFCIGGSTTYGRPFDDTTSFCGWMRALLERIEPSGWEVVNAGGVSYASYRAAAVMEELTAYEPDLFVIYSAHNEFLEQRTYSGILAMPQWLRETDATLRRTRAYSALRRAFRGWRGPVSRAARAELPEEVEAVLDRSIGPDAYTRDDELRERVLSHYEFNLGRMVEVARSSGAQPLLVVPASNRSDCTPFKSEFSVATSDLGRNRWREEFQRGRTALNEGRAREAQRAFERAVEVDPRRADGLYWLGRAASALGDSVVADAAYDRAREEDVCPLRALASATESVRDIAVERGVGFVDFPDLLRRASSRGDSRDPFGEGYFLDHVHPTIDAHGLLAVGIVRGMIDGGILDAPYPTSAVVSGARSEVLASVDERRQGTALRNLAKVLSWAGKTEDAARAARLALSHLGIDAESDFILGTWMSDRGQWSDAIYHYERALRSDPDYPKAINNLGIALMRAGRSEQAVAAYEKALWLEPEHPSARYNLANALVRLGRVDAAVSHYREVLRMNPRDVDAHYNLARVYEKRGDRALADDHYRAAKTGEGAPGSLMARG